MALEKEKLGEVLPKLKQIQQHQLFQDAIYQFWTLLQVSPANRLPRSELRRLLHRVYKLVVPRYNEATIDPHVSSVLAYYVGTAESLDLATFARVLFDIADAWTPNVDLFEYVAFLRAVHSRIVTVLVHKSDHTVASSEARVVLRFPDDEARVDLQLPGNEGQWQTCAAEEPEDEGWEYSYKELTAGKKSYQKLKRPKAPSKSPKASGGLSVEEDWQPVVPPEWVPTGMEIERRLADLESVVPFGYFGELFLLQLANKAEEKSGVSAMLTDDVIIKNAIKQGTKNDKAEVPIEILPKMPGLAHIHAVAEIGMITQLLVHHTIKGAKEHKVMLRIPFKANYAAVAREYGNVPQGLDLRRNSSLGLQRKLVLEQLKLTHEPEFVNINYTVERADVKRAIESNIYLKGDRNHLVLTSEDAPAAPTKAKAEDSTRDPTFLNDIDFNGFMQLLLAHKQLAIKKECKGAKRPDAKDLNAASVLAPSHKPSDNPLYRLQSSKPVLKDAWTSENAAIEYAKQEVPFDYLGVVLGDLDHQQAQRREICPWSRDREGFRPRLHRDRHVVAEAARQGRQLSAAHRFA